MFPMILSILLSVAPDDAGARKDDVQFLIHSIEAVQQPIGDFRCEFEGTIRFKGKVAEDMKLGGDGLYESFSGVFIWKTGGDTHSESLNRRASDGQVARETLVIRMREHQAERYHRLNDGPIGVALIEDPKQVNSSLPSCLGSIFLIDQIKRDASDKDLEASVYDDDIEGRQLRVLNIALAGVPGSLIRRYWIDLRRNGHVVRQENYQPGKVMIGRLDIKLSPFKLGDREVWMPTHGDSAGYVAFVDNRVVVTKEPTSLNTIHVLAGTLEFNKRPGPEAFTIKYKPGTPISDNLRKLTYEFGQQKIATRPTKSDVEIAEAEQQKTELVVAPPSDNFDWTSWTIWGFGGLVLVSSVVLRIQRRRH
jgi:hypothetical protein